VFVIIIFSILFTVIGYSYHRWPAVMEFSFLAACCCVKLLLYWLWLIWQINFSLSLSFIIACSKQTKWTQLNWNGPNCQFTLCISC